MRIRLKFTIMTDLDLLSLMHIPEFDFRAWVRDSLRTYAGSGITRKVPLPAAIPADMTLQSIIISISLDKKKDAAVKKWLSTLKNRQRTGAIKAVLRGSLEEPCLFAHNIAYPATFLASPLDKEGVAAKAAGRTDPVAYGVNMSGIQPSQTASAQSPEVGEDEDYDFFNMSMEITE